MQYQLLGVGSGFFAHILATLLVCWRRTLKTGVVVGAMTALAVEGIGFALTHQFPPSVATHALAAALALALACGIGATVFTGELLRGALRALSLLQGESVARTEAARLTAQSRSGGAWKGLVTPLPLTPATPPRPAGAVRRGAAASLQRILASSAPQVQTSLPLSDVRHYHHHHMRFPAATPAKPVSNQALAPQVFVPMFVPGGAVGGLGEPFRSFENDPTQPITVCEEDSAMVVLLPENSLYVRKFVPKPPAVAYAPAFGPSQRARASRMGALPPLAGVGSVAAPVASASPSPALYAPWSTVPPLGPADAPRRGQRMARFGWSGWSQLAPR